MLLSPRQLRAHARKVKLLLMDVDGVLEEPNRARGLPGRAKSGRSNTKGGLYNFRNKDLDKTGRGGVLFGTKNKVKLEIPGLSPEGPTNLPGWVGRVVVVTVYV